MEIAVLGEGLKLTVEAELGNIRGLRGTGGTARGAHQLDFNAVDACRLVGSSRFAFSPERRVALEVADTGTGMTEEVRRHCLEPFFSTKGDRGTGMGWRWFYGIQIGMEAGCISKARGYELRFLSRFRSMLPGQNRAVGITRGWRPLSVLVADHQPILCEILDEYLTRDCHIVETACRRREAFERFQRGRFGFGDHGSGDARE